MAGLTVMHHLMEPVIILPTDPIRMVNMASAEDSAEDSAEASAEALAEASAEEDDGGKPENPGLRAALEYCESRAAESKRAREVHWAVFCLIKGYSGWEGADVLVENNL
jgi:hypothetical protein